uniref:Uncharacterized protein n=1 Tax=Arion vulgaris TaxID=1028688 RepID=A0A0B6ZXX8_9EUPU
MIVAKARESQVEKTWWITQVMSQATKHPGQAITKKKKGQVNDIVKNRRCND